MVSALRRRAVPLLSIGLGMIVFTSSAAAAPPGNPFGCRASVSAARANSPAPAVEPYVANPQESPCVTASAGSNGTTGSSASGGAAYTYSTSSADPSTGAVSPGATALATSNGGSTNGPGEQVTIAGPAQAQASYSCVKGAPMASGTSDVTAAYVNGQTVRPASPGAAATTQLGNGSYVTINQRTQTATSLTERLVFEHIAGVGDYITGEAQVALAATNPCAGTSGFGSGSGSSLQACPGGSKLVASARLCEIVQPGKASIVVSQPFAGPTGASVMSLAAARKKYKSSCLSGRGAKFVVVGTNRANRITAGKQTERILALGGNDRVSAKNASDCIDGGAGRDRISVGNGNDRLFGGLGNDTITAGSGRDSISGGAGNDRITVGKGKDHLSGGAGNDRLSDPGKVAYVNGGRGKDVAFVTTKAMKYARRHGCERVHRIRAKA